MKFLLIFLLSLYINSIIPFQINKDEFIDDTIDKNGNEVEKENQNNEIEYKRIEDKIIEDKPIEEKKIDKEIEITKNLFKTKSNDEKARKILKRCGETETFDIMIKVLEEQVIELEEIEERLKKKKKNYSKIRPPFTIRWQIQKGRLKT